MTLHEIATALLPTFDHCPRKHLHVSIILSRKGQLLAVGVNRMALSRWARARGYTRSTHSEVDALRRVRGVAIRNRKGWEMVNFRLSRTGKIGISRPCAICQEVLHEEGIKKVRYS